jgi:hypothetical protein
MSCAAISFGSSIRMMRSRRASTLVPLTDFSPRKNEALERGYLRGRYGGVPLISSLRHTSYVWENGKVTGKGLNDDAKI